MQTVLVTLGTIEGSVCLMLPQMSTVICPVNLQADMHAQVQTNL